MRGLASHLDLVFLAVVLPVFVLAGLPLAGYLAAAAAWIVQRAISAAATKRAAASRDPKTVAGLMVASMIGRGWLVALTIFAVGYFVERRAGLAAAVLFIVLFTFHATTQLFTRPFERREVPS